MKIIRNPEYITADEFLGEDQSVEIKVNNANAAAAFMRRALGFPVMGVLLYSVGDNRVVQFTFDFEEDDDIPAFRSLSSGKRSEFTAVISKSPDGMSLDITEAEYEDPVDGHVTFG